ncbi:putative aldose sugar dehydrogenase [metagenome]|uniref:Putative aldose sugar dehydrogenase n=1 Tax=metagenome TaxID=256318 RepID=A0A2P2C1E3_9ZZZZ
MRTPAVTAVLALALSGLGVVPVAAHPPDSTVRAAGAGAKAVPELRVRRVVKGLAIPWDVQPIGKGRLLVTQRDLGRLIVSQAGEKHRVRLSHPDVWVSGETGLMSLAVAKDFATSRRFYTCQGGNTAGGGHDVRVLAWKLNKATTRATRQQVLIKGLPTSSGRHGGCRLLLLDGGALLVGTGDAATGTNPQNLRSLGGKTLRLNPMTGAPSPGNPWPSAANRNRRYIYTYGHRNVQGLAQRANGTLWSVEHGSFRDDEVNRLFKGANYGWNPVPGYDESVPMTDFSLPGKQVGARWRSGDPTLATSGASWVHGKQWGALNGTLAVAALKASELLFMRFDASGHLVRVRTPAALTAYGRLRSVTSAANGDLLVTTSNGSDDAVLRVHPVS